jgi:hypothetical protein
VWFTGQRPSGLSISQGSPRILPERSGGPADFFTNSAASEDCLETADFYLAVAQSRALFPDTLHTNLTVGFFSLDKREKGRFAGSASAKLGDKAISPIFSHLLPVMFIAIITIVIAISYCCCRCPCLIARRGFWGGAGGR